MKVDGVEIKEGGRVFCKLRINSHIVMVAMVIVELTKTKLSIRTNLSLGG